ncbi:c-type cytochrome domain-containing protein [Stieleria maiorica]|nr:c-type cytochrome domain-containing protein [Stieleria maiorica]
MNRIIPLPFRCTVLLVVLMGDILVGGAAEAVELDRRQKAIVSTIGATITRAGKDYFEGKYESSGNEIRKALEQVERAVDLGSPELYDAIVVHIDKISRAHAMLELEGVSLPPFRRPARPTGTPSMSASDAPAPGSPAPPFFDTSGTLVSFTKDVAPILSGKCGRCHVSERRGGFSASSYAALMKGPPEGVVVFAGDVIGSRLIETIETGDMPRGGTKVSADELRTLKEWIAQGAKFDGDDPNQMLAAGTAPTPAMDTKPPAITQATGKETVSFSFDIAPLLVENCGGCHIDAMQVRGGLRMDSFVQMMRGGDSGAIITPGRGEASLLVKKLRGTATDGERMPAGGRPPLGDDAIALISKWIDEGATLDANESQPIKVISKLAWASRATSAEKSAKRAELADRNFKLANPSAPLAEHQTDHFRVVGSGSQETLKVVGLAAEKHLKVAKSVARPKSSTSDEDYFGGHATIFVLPRRYDYSEFAKMVEQRSVPSDWSAHWQFDGIDAYVATVASETEDEEAIESRLLAPIVSLAVATRGGDVPRWFAEGLGAATAMQQNAKSRSEKEKLRTLAVEAASSVKDAKAFLGNKLTPEQADSFGTALAMSMLERNRRKGLEATLRLLGDGKSFDDAFVGGFGVTPTVYIDQLLQFAR